jgi:thioredoxin-dependent peroxiredoxin
MLRAVNPPRVGDVAPDFTARTTKGELVTLSSLRGNHVVLYFFPKAFTPGCTRQTQRFRDAHADIVELGGMVLGVSVDDFETQCDFAAAMQASFPMIGDEDLSVSQLYGVLRPFLKLAKRVTFVIDRDGVVRGVFEHEFQISKHLDAVLHLLERLRSEPEPQGTRT